MAKCEVDLAIFTSRENEVFCLLKKGYTRKEIADMMIVSLRTIETRMQCIHAKLGTNSIVELLSFDGEIKVVRRVKQANTKNKQRVQELLMKGRSPKEIAKEMQFGIATIHTWRRELVEQGKLPKLNQRQPIFSCLKYANN